MGPARKCLHLQQHVTVEDARFRRYGSAGGFVVGVGERGLGTRELLDLNLAFRLYHLVDGLPDLDGDRLLRQVRDGGRCERDALLACVNESYARTRKLSETSVNESILAYSKITLKDLLDGADGEILVGDGARVTAQANEADIGGEQAHGRTYERERERERERLLESRSR